MTIISNTREANENLLNDVEKLWKYRDSVIRREYAECPYKEGDIVRPDQKGQFEELGYLRVRGIIKTYREWPKGEEFPPAPKKPMIVLAECLDKPTAFNCTVNYLRKATAEEIEAMELKSTLEKENAKNDEKA